MRKIQLRCGLRTFWVLATVIAVSGIAFGCTPDEGTEIPDEATEIAAIRAAIDGYLEAWHRADTSAIASYYDEDYDWMNPIGMHLRGRDAVVRFQAASFARELPPGVERSLHYDIDSIRLITDDVAVVDIRYSHVGSPIPTGTVDHRIVSVLVKREGRWLRAAQRNFTLVGGTG